MKRQSDEKKVLIILTSVLLIVSFWQSKRIGINVTQIENPVLRSLVSGYVAVVEQIKQICGLASFFENQENFWQEVKTLPQFLLVGAEKPVETANPNSEKPSFFSKIKPPYRIIIVGDSFVAESFGPALEKQLLLLPSTEVFRRGIYSTGFSRPDYFDWYKELDRLIVENQPNVAFAMFGANDGQDQTGLDKKIIHYGDPGWNEEYEKRVSLFLQILKDNRIFVFWIGMPIARDKYYSDKMANLNSIYTGSCHQSKNCLYLNTWTLLANDEGKYSAYLPDSEGKLRLVRASDGIHTTFFGSQILLKGIMPKILSELDFQSDEKGKQ